MKEIKTKSVALKGALVKKLKGNSGESIAETLVAVLISAFALLMLAGTVNTASKLITKGQHTLEDYYDNNNSLAEHKATGSDVSLMITVSGYGISETDSVTVYKPGNTGSSSFGQSLIAYG